MNTKIKVCGITLVEQALQLESMGIHYIGLNFVPTSKRRIEPALAQEITQSLDKAHCTVVGVFMDQPENAVREVLAKVAFDVLQFHGDESPQYCAQFGLPYIKVIGIDQNVPENELALHSSADFWLFDTKRGSTSGGTGETFDWSLLKKLGLNNPVANGPLKPWFLAGGLGPYNVAQAMQDLAPWGLDLNSKFETSPGVKDIDRIKECLEGILRQ